MPDVPDPRFTMSLTPEQLRNVILHVFQSEAQPLIEAVFASMQSMQDTQKSLAAVLDVYEARLRRLEMQAMVDDALN